MHSSNSEDEESYERYLLAEYLPYDWPKIPQTINSAELVVRKRPDGTGDVVYVIMDTSEKFQVYDKGSNMVDTIDHIEMEVIDTGYYHGAFPRRDLLELAEEMNAFANRFTLPMSADASVDDAESRTYYGEWLTLLPFDYGIFVKGTVECTAEPLYVSMPVSAEDLRMLADLIWRFVESHQNLG